MSFEKPATFPRPGPAGRVARISAGIALLSLFVSNLTDYRLAGDPNPPSLPWWFGVAVSFYFLDYVFAIGFYRSWGRWSQVVLLLLALVAVAFDLVQYGSFWGPPLAVLLYLLTEFVLGVIGLSFLLSAILATPG